MSDYDRPEPSKTEQAYSVHPSWELARGTDTVSENDHLRISSAVINECSRFERERRRDEMRWLLQRLADRAYAETQRAREGLEAYQVRLKFVCRIVQTFSSSLTPDIPFVDEPNDGIWERRDPIIGYRDGLKSPYQTRFDMDVVERCAADYLEHPWMRDPYFDWMFVDAMITREISVYGEEIKRRYLPGPRDALGALHYRYSDTGGNLAAMMKTDWPRRIKHAALYIGLGIIAPICAIAFAANAGWETTTAWLIGLYMFVILIEVGCMIWVLSRRLIRWSRGISKPVKKATSILNSMYDVWSLLEGPVVNPSLVKTEMVKSSDRGAVWATSVWSIVDRAIARDAAVWIVAGPKT